MSTRRAASIRPAEEPARRVRAAPAAACTEIIEDKLPDTVVAGRDGFGEPGWGGPQSPIGDQPHRYFFHLFAVDRPLGLREGASAADVRAAIEGHQLAHGTQVGLFGR